MIRGAHTTITMWQAGPLPVSAVYVSKTILTENTSSGILQSYKKTGKDLSVSRDPCIRANATKRQKKMGSLIFICNTFLAIILRQD